MSELQRGIQTIYNMEQNIYLMQNVLNDLDGQISRLGKQEHFSEPEKRTVYADFDNYIGKSAGASVLIAFIISIINIFIKLEKAGGALSGAKFSALGSGLVFGFWCFVIAIAIGLIIGSIITFAKKSEQQDRAKRKYERAYKNYLEKIDNDTARVNAELAKTEKDPLSEPSSTTSKMQEGVSNGKKKPSVKKELAELKVEAKKLDEQKSKEKVIANIPTVQNNKKPKVKSSR